MITITVDTSQLDKTLSDFPARMAAAQKRALEYIGQKVASRAQQAFRSPSFRPSPWEPRKSGGNHPLLIKSGALRQSISWKLEGTDTVVIGSDKKYAIYHQEGTKHMPARPFFPIDKYGQLTILGTITKRVGEIYAEEVSGKGGAGG